MAHYGTLREFRFSEHENDINDVRGSKLYGVDDEKLGKIDDVIFEHATGNIQYVVVDTGGWLLTKKFLVPRSRLRSSTKHEGEFSTDLTKRQVESFPAYDDTAIESDAKWTDYEKRYRSASTANPVQHREGTDRTITPTATEFPPEPGAIGSQISPELNQELSERIIPAASDEVRISSSGAGLGDRWSTFESRLRERRKEVTGNCVTCDQERSARSVGENDLIRRKAS
jgi:sporulation protein YlmC with PRC-barrel domain